LTVALSTLIFRLWPSFPLVALAGSVAGGHRRCPRAGGCRYYPRTGRPRRVGGTAGQNQRFAAAGGVVVTSR
jgi:hypothetical protein